MPIMDMRGAVSWGVGNIVYTHAYIDRAKVSNENITLSPDIYNYIVHVSLLYLEAREEFKYISSAKANLA